MRSSRTRWVLLLMALLLSAFICTDGQAFTVNVVTESSPGVYTPIPVGFRYLIEEDNSFHVIPGTPTPEAVWPDPSNTLAVEIHKSHAPVVCSGDTGMVGGAATVNTASNPNCVIDPNKKYIVSVIPWHVNPLIYPNDQPNGPFFANQGGYTMSARNVAGNDTNPVNIIVTPFPVPTAQITVLVFHDNQPINGAYDQPAESGLGGFELLLTDPVGKMMQDAWGNPVGTTYQVQRDTANCTTVLPYFPSHSFCPPIKGANGTYKFINDTNGVPLIDYAGNGTLTSCPSGNAGYDRANCTDLDTGAALSPGEAVIRFLAPDRYALEIVPPAADPDWFLTSTLEGTRANDSWVRAAEPRFNIQLGQLNWLVFYGYVKACDAYNGASCTPLVELTPPAGPKGTITGQVVFAHDMHPPLSPGLSVGAPVPNCYVGLNNLSNNDEQVYTAACNADSTFSITNVPPGLYQLVMWDTEINAIIDFRNVTVPSTGGTIALGPVAVYSWWGQLRGSVFSDASGTATLPTAALPAGDGRGISNMRVNVHFSDGSLYASQFTDAYGNYFFTQMFPWWRWLVVETDPGVNNENTGKWRTTGMTTIVDDGGNITTPCPAGFQCPPNAPGYAAYGINPQLQPENANLPYRVQPTVGGEEVLTQAMMLFQDMTNVINWGKQQYAAGENGGIKGFISYATSRTQENPERALWQGWEPGVPRVEVDLFASVQACVNSTNGAIGAVCTNNTAACSSAETCNWVPATCSVSTINGVNTLTGCIPQAGTPSPLNVTYTDSWDDNNPTDCVAQAGTPWSNPQTVNGIQIRRCAETFRTWDQVRPGVFDGAYLFSSYCSGTLAASYTPLIPVNLDGSGNATFTGGKNVTCNGTPDGFTDGLPIGNYIVKAVPPVGYKIMKYGDRNIEFGEPDAAFQSYAPQCVGPQYPVPAFHTLFTDWQIPTLYPGFFNTSGGAVSTWYCNGQPLFNSDGSMNTGLAINPDGTCNPPSGGPMAPSCEMKNTTVATGQSSIVDFRIFTEVPKASGMWGWVSDDLHLESNPNSPNASSNYAPSNIPVAIKDWSGKTVWRGYTDQWGKFAGRIPSTYTIYTPNPLGMSAGLYTVAVNDPGPIVQGSELTGMPRVCDGTQPGTAVCVTDPYFSRVYGQEVIRENWDFYAGTTTFIDTIVIPTSAVLSRSPLDCEPVDHTPGIKQVDSAGSGPIVTAGAPSTLTITSLGTVEEANPSFDPILPPSAPASCAPANPAPSGTNCALIWRDHGFGATKGTVTLRRTVNNLPVDTIISGNALGWSNDAISANLPALAAANYQLIVTRPNPNPNNPKPANLSSVVGVTLHAITTATPVVVVHPPASNCDPYTDTTQCLRIQTAINSAPNGAIISIAPGTYMENVLMYKPQTLQGWGAWSTFLDGTAALANFPGRDQWNTLFQSLVGAACSATTPCISIPPGGLTDFVFEQGAGIMVSACDHTANACANDFTRTPSMIDGVTVTGATEAGGGVYVNSYAPNLQVSNNEIYSNQGNLGGGIRVGSPSIVNGSVYTSYHNENMKIVYNHVSQNGSLTSGGGGISLYKGSDNYQVSSNLICGNFAIVYGGGICHFGLSPNGLISKNVIVSNESFDQGGGIIVAGELPIAAGTGLTEGSGSVQINDNLIQGNKAGDDGGGINTLMTNGQDVANDPTHPLNWYAVSIFNNMIVNNSSGDHGGGLAFDDSVFVYLINNTIAQNDSTSTGSGAFTSGACVEGDPTGQLCPPPGEAIGGLQNSTPRVGGIAAYAYSQVLNTAVNAAKSAHPAIPSNVTLGYTNPYMYNDIIFQNRTYFWNATANNQFGSICFAQGHGVTTDCNLTNPDWWDLAVYGLTSTTVMHPHNSVLTNTTDNTSHYGGQQNVFAGTLNPATGTNAVQFIRPYFNVYEASSKGAAFGNFVNVYFLPIGLMSGLDLLYGDYHILSTSPASGVGSLSVTNVQLTNNLVGTVSNIRTFWPNLTNDYDGQTRTIGRRGPDSGADTYFSTENWFPW